MNDVAQSAPTPLQKSIQHLLHRGFDYFFYAYVFVTVFLPSGSFYGINFKSPLCIGLLPLAFYNILSRKQALLSHLVLLLVVPSVLFGWVALGLSNGFELSAAIRQYSDILLTFLLCWLAYVFCGSSEARRLQFLKLVLISEIATAALKVGLIAYALLSGKPVIQLIFLLSKVFGADLMTMDLGSLFGRVQFIADELIPVCIFAVLRHRDRMRLGSVRASLIILLLLTSVAFSFSRYFWGFTAVALVVGLLLGRRDRFKLILVGVLSVATLASLPALTSLYQLRFSKAVAGSSDSARLMQIPALQEFFQEAPFWGHGLGSYTSHVVRGGTEAGRYAYEVQLLALSAQVGVVGMCLLLALAAYYFSNLWLGSRLNLQDRLGISLLLAFWLVAGLSNPLLFHPVAGINYAALAALSALSSRAPASESTPGSPVMDSQGPG